jgi:hypothetical protein
MSGPPDTSPVCYRFVTEFAALERDGHQTVTDDRGGVLLEPRRLGFSQSRSQIAGNWLVQLPSPHWPEIIMRAQLWPPLGSPSAQLS